MSSLVVMGLPFTIPSPVDRTRGGRCTDLGSCVRTIVIPSVRGGLERKFKHTLHARASAYIISVLSRHTKRNNECRRRMVYTLPDYGVTGSVGSIRRFVQGQGNIRCCLWPFIILLRGGRVLRRGFNNVSETFSIKLLMLVGDCFNVG